MKRLALVTTAVALIAGLVSCATDRAYSVDDPSQIGEDRVILVGTITIDPPLDSDLYDGMGTFEPTIGLIFDGRPYTAGQAGVFDFEDSAIVGSPTLGERFFLAVPNIEPFYIGTAVLRATKSGGLFESETLHRYYMGAYRISFPADATFVYMGELRFTMRRDEDNGRLLVDKISLPSRYDEARAEATERFGGEIELVRADVRPAREDEFQQ